MHSARKQSLANNRDRYLGGQDTYLFFVGEDTFFRELYINELESVEKILQFSLQ